MPRLWGLLKEEKPLREAYKEFYSMNSRSNRQLEQDVLDLLGQLMENGLVEAVAA